MLDVCGKYTTFGKCTIDLRDYERELTHRISTQLEDCNAEVLLLLTISGTTAAETISDLTAYREDKVDREKLEAKYVRTLSIFFLLAKMLEVCPEK